MDHDDSRALETEQEEGIARLDCGVYHDDKLGI